MTAFIDRFGLEASLWHGWSLCADRMKRTVATPGLCRANWCVISFVMPQARTPDRFARYDAELALRLSTADVCEVR